MSSTPPTPVRTKKRVKGRRRRLSLVPDLGHRKDIQGLRALAILAVVLYHAQVPYINGGFIGVDFFFVLSGFLITYLLVAEFQKHQRISLKKFWGGRAKRLIPASLLVILTTIALSLKYIPYTERKAVSLDSIYSLFFSANWRFAQQQTDYLASDRNPSPFLHYWSLGVEEQFYLIWPSVIALLGLLLAHRMGIFRKVLATVFSLLFIASFSYCVYLTAVNQPYAFFGTPTRAWQLMAGALTALTLTHVHSWPSKLKLILSLGGLALFGGAAFFLRENGAVSGSFYPSWLALFPTVAAVMLILGGTGSTHIISKFLSLPPLPFLGDISYSLYLWHWPALVLGPYIFTVNTLPARLGYATGALLLAVLTYKLVENPLRYSKKLAARPLTTIGLGLTMLTVSVVPAYGLGNPSAIKSIDLKKETATVAKVPYSPVRWLTSTELIQSTDGDSDVLKPSLDEAASDEPSQHSPCQKTSAAANFELPELSSCIFGAEDYKYTVFITGDSISTAITPGVIAWAEKHQWRVILMSLSSCTFSDVNIDHSDKHYVGCGEFTKNSYNEILRLKPELLIIANAYSSNDGVFEGDTLLTGEEAYPLAAEGYLARIKAVQANGTQVAVVSPPPRTKDEAPVSCLAKMKNADECHFSKVKDFDFMKYVYENNKKVYYVDTLSTYCGDDCFPVVKNYVVYRDKVHFTSTYSEAVLPPLFGKLFTQVEKVIEDDKPKK